MIGKTVQKIELFFETPVEKKEKNIILVRYNS